MPLSSSDRRSPQNCAGIIFLNFSHNLTTRKIYGHRIFSLKKNTTAYRRRGQVNVPEVILFILQQHVERVLQSRDKMNTSRPVAMNKSPVASFGRTENEMTVRPSSTELVAIESSQGL